MNESPDLVGINDATRITGLDKGTLYRLARQRRLRTFRVLGRALRFERADLLNLLVPRGDSDMDRAVVAASVKH
jgi:excisionase family DNA binding protein